MKKSSVSDEIKSIGLAILLVLAMVGISWIIYKVTRIKFENKRNIGISKTDTIYISEIFTIPEPYEIVLNPAVIEIYKTDTTSKYNEFSLREKDLVLFTPNHVDSVSLSKIYLNTLPFNPKLLHIDLTQNQLSLGLMDIEGNTRRDIYPLDLSNYRYQWSNNQLTQKTIRRIKFEPTIGYQYRPLNNLHDMDLYLNLKTKGFNYKFGLNGFYYPKLHTNPSWDFVIGITYNLNK